MSYMHAVKTLKYITSYTIVRRLFYYNGSSTVNICLDVYMPN